MEFSTEHKKDVCFQGSAPEMQFPARKKINSMFHSTKCTWNAASKKWTILSRPHSVPPCSGVNCIPVYAWINYAIIRHHWLSVWWQGSKFHSSDRLRQTKMTVGQVEYRKDLSDGQLHISDFHISCIGFIYFRQVNGTFGQVIFTIHLPDRQVHSIWNFEACDGFFPVQHNQYWLADL